MAIAAGAIATSGVGCEPPPRAAHPTPTASVVAPAPKRSGTLVLALVVDQLGSWHAVERLGTLPKGGGFAKLLAESNQSAELHFGYVQTSTSMGHVALFSGLSPRDSKITSNGRVLPSGRYQGVIADEATKLVDASGAIDATGSSLRAFSGETLADAAKRQRPELFVGALSIKDRGVVFAAGRTPDAALWFDTKRDALVTSTAFAASVPSFARRFAATGVSAPYRVDPWLPRDPKWLAGVTDLPAPDLGQGDFHGLGARFPHDLSKTTDPTKAFVFTPAADQLLGDVALAALDALPPDRDALLSVSFSAYDYVAHVFGPDAPEAWDELYRLDAELARVLLRADELYGSSGYAVVLSADHGGPSTPEVLNQGFCGRPDPDRWERRCERSLRLSESGLAAIGEAAAQRAVGPGHWVRGVDEPLLELTPEARALPKDRRDALGKALVEALSSAPGVARVVETRALPGPCPALSDESLDALICRSVSGEIGGDVLIVPKPGAFFETGYVEGKGENHGTPYLFDRAVPLIVRAPRAEGAPATPQSYDGALVVDQRAYAATLAALLHITPPEGAQGGRDLSKESK